MPADIHALRSGVVDNMRIAFAQLLLHMGYFLVERVVTFAVLSAFAQHERLNDGAQQFRRQVLRRHEHRFRWSVIRRTRDAIARHTVVIV